MIYLSPIDASNAGRLTIPTYANVAALPAAASNTGALAYTSSEQYVHYSDGTNWYRLAKIGETPYVATATTYAVTLANRVIECDGTFDVTLLTAVGNTNAEFIIKNVGTGKITLKTTSSQTIDGSLTVKLLKGDSITVFSNGANWIIN